MWWRCNFRTRRITSRRCGSGAGGHRGNEGGFSPAEGNPGGSPDPSQFGPGTDFNGPPGFGSGGGGSGGVGSVGGGSGGNGGSGATFSITGSPFAAAAGGAGGAHNPGSGGGGGSPGSGGSGGGESNPGGSASAHGSGGGGGGGGPSSQHAQGGSGSGGRVVVRTPSDFSIAATPPSIPTTDHPGGDSMADFTQSGTFTITKA